MRIRQSIAWIAAALLLILGAAGAEEPTILEDPEGGRWEYHSESLNIVIEKFTEKVKSGSKKKTREYCVADIQASPESPLYPVMTDPTSKRPAGYKMVSPELLQEKAHPRESSSGTGKSSPPRPATARRRGPGRTWTPWRCCRTEA